MTTKHELVINTNEPSAPNADSFIHRILMKLLFLHISVIFLVFQVGKTYFTKRLSYDDRKSVLFNHRDFNDKTKTLPVYKNGYPNLEMFKEEEHFKITKSIKYVSTLNI